MMKKRKSDLLLPKKLHFLLKVHTMIVISDLSRNYVKEVAAAETLTIVGGFYDIDDSFNYKSSYVDIKQLNLGSFASSNYVGSVNTYQ
jgi:hypothetical protein